MRYGKFKHLKWSECTLLEKFCRVLFVLIYIAVFVACFMRLNTIEAHAKCLSETSAETLIAESFKNVPAVYYGECVDKDYAMQYDFDNNCITIDLQNVYYQYEKFCRKTDCTQEQVFLALFRHELQHYYQDCAGLYPTSAEVVDAMECEAYQWECNYLGFGITTDYGVFQPVRH